MAEFQEVMRQLGRICATNFGECDICDLRPFCPTSVFLDKYLKSGRAKRLEEMVLSWAAGHPEPVYPTWGTWLGTKYDCDMCEILYTPIPADIAEKLGIEPKEVER